MMNHSATTVLLRRPFLVTVLDFFAWTALFFSASKSPAQSVHNPLLALTNVQQVAKFGLERARVEHPRVRWEGVVTFLTRRDPGDMRLLGYAPWWESLRPGRILAVSAGLGALALVWIGLLRRQIAQRKQAEADTRLLFQAFHRGRNVGDRPGTGLGMTIVKRCVELHGGRIGFESKEGLGTTFIVALPLLGASAGGNGEQTTQFIRAAADGRNVTFIP